MPMPSVFDGYIEVLAKVSSTCLITVNRNRYSVPCHLAHQRVSVRLYPERIAVYADQQQVATHARQFGRDQVCYDWQHYIRIAERKPGVLRNGAPFNGMPAPLLSLQQSLTRYDGGDRIMAQVLAAVPLHGLDAVLVAVTLIVETGAVSAEHVTNVITRLCQAPPPQRVETTLTVKDEPIADPSRYDQLRPQEVSHV